MIGTWFDTLDPNRRTLTVALILICLATMPLYGVGVWRLKSADHTAQAHALDTVMVDEGSSPTEEPVSAGAVPQAPEGREPEPAPVAPIRQAAPAPAPVVAPAPQAAKPAPARAPAPAKRSGPSEHGHGEKEKKR